MSGPVEFLTAVAQALSALALYPEGHGTRERALDVVFARLQDLLAEDPAPQFSFLGDEVVFGDRPLRDLRDWDWSRRLADAGVQRVQFDRTATRDELEDFLDQALARLTLRALDSSEARPTRTTGIRFGAVGIRGEEQFLDEGEIEEAAIQLSLGPEASTVRWMHGELQGGAALPLAEAEAVVRSLSVAMHGDQDMLLPLLKLRQFDEYTTTHALNVSVLTMALAEWIGLGARDVRAFGVAGLLHDLGKVKIPEAILNKPGKLTPEERGIMNAHPAEGAKIILETEPDLDLAAVVAYEHHIMINGGGYPGLRYARQCHHGSKLVHVCDVYDALRTNRPYREAWPAEKVLAYMEERSGVEFDGEVAHAFAAMMREWEPKVAQVAEDEAIPA